MWAFNRWTTVWVEKMFARLRGIIVVRDKIFDNGQVGELEAPASPFAYATKRPPAFNMEVLAAPTPERMCTI
jgi:hypothetical protein